MTEQQEPLPDDFPYKDIFYLKRPHSCRATQLDAESRAAQFMPFDALTGFDESIAETERFTVSHVPQDGYGLAELNLRFGYLKIRNFPKVRVTLNYFKNDKIKAGGSYESLECIIRNIDEVGRRVFLEGNEVLNFDAIESIEGEIFDELEL